MAIVNVQETLTGKHSELMRNSDATNASGTRDAPVDFEWIVREDANAIVVYDADFRYQYVNSEAERLLRKPFAELQGRVVWEVFPEAVGTPMYHAQMQVFQTGRATTYEAEFAPLDLVYEAHCTPYDWAGQRGLILRWGDIRARKQNEQALSAREERFRSLVEATAQIVWTNTPTGSMEPPQTGWSQFTGQGDDEYRGYGWAKAVHPDDAQPTLDAWKDAVREKRLFVFSHRVRRHDGVWRMFAIRAVPILEDNGAIREWVGVHTDITEQEAQEEELRRSEERLRLAVEAGRMGTWELNFASGRVTLDNATAAMFGRDVIQEVDVDLWGDWIHPADREQTLLHFKKLVASDAGEYRIEFRTLWPDRKTIRRVVAHAVIRRNETGAARRIVGVCRDVTDKRAIEDARATALAQLEAVLASTSDGIIVSDLDGKVLMMNPAALRLHGYHNVLEAQSRGGLAAQSLLKTPDSEYLPVVKWPLARLMRGEQFTQYDLMLHHANTGLSQWVSYSGSVARDGSGHPILLVLTLRDITERRQAMEREAFLRREVEKSAERQRRFLREMLNAMTEGRLHLCDSEADLPTPLAEPCERVALDSRSLRRLRRDARSMAFDLGFDAERVQDLETSVGEAAMNAVVHAGGGTGQVFQDTARATVQVWVRDTGRGITDEALHRATLERGFSSAGTLGHGFWMMLKTCDRVYLLTGPTGTTVVLEQERTAPLPLWMRTPLTSGDGAHLSA